MSVSWRILDRVLAYGASAAAALVLGTAILAPPLTSGVAAGAAIAFFNIYGSRVLLPRAVTPERVSPLYGLLLFFKFGAGFALLTVAAFVFKVNLIGLVVGFGGLFFSGVGFALVHETMRATPADAS
ncbi:MAG: hypothetical protein AAF658_18355 [Myxococcota bacterium]